MQSACSSSERYTGKKKARVLVLMLSCFHCAHSLAMSVQQAAGITLSLGQIWLLASLCLPDLAGTSLCVPLSVVRTLLGCWLY